MQGQCFGLVFSITSKRSFEYISTLYEEVLKVKDAGRTYIPIRSVIFQDEQPCVIFGNKCDLEKEREVSSNEAREFAKSIGAPYFETSAKARTNVDEAFHEIVRQVSFPAFCFDYFSTNDMLPI